MKTLFAVLATLMLSFSANAIVDMKNANYSDTWTDIIVPGSGYDLRIMRTYNSRTLYNGMFGFGWCSDFETKLDVTAEGNVKVTECGGGLEVTFSPRGYDKKQVDSLIEKAVAEVKKRNSTLSKGYITKLRKDLNTKPFFRDELFNQLGFKGKVQAGRKYFAAGRKDEHVVFTKKKQYKRTLDDGTHQLFDKDGKLVALYDKNGNFLKISYRTNRITKVADNNGRTLNFQYTGKTPRVRLISGPSGLSASYKYKGEDLKWAKNSSGQVYQYETDKLHNITKVIFPDKTTKKIRYNEDKDWVVSFTDRRSCTESYDYQENKKNPLNHYWSLVTKKCKGKVTNKSRYEFIHKVSKAGKRYLDTAISIVNGNKTEFRYHPIFGKPVYSLRNKVVTRFQYNKSGQIRYKFEPLLTSKFEYKNSCRKVSSVETKLYQRRRPAASKGKKKPSVKKVVKTVTTRFGYDKKKCNLKTANNSEGQKVSLQYDARGRINRIKDQSKKIVNISYENRFGKPRLISRPGLGSLSVTYKPSGQIDKVKSKEGPIVGAQVGAVFNNLLEIISPATSELSI